MGQPHTVIRYTTLWEVYPHLRGAALYPVLLSGRLGGISPPAWGSPLYFLSALINLRYIPTCVGQPSVRSLVDTLEWVYPHLRGAACDRAVKQDGHGGISPPAWGSQRSRPGISPSPRYIPTCVGQPYSACCGKRGITVYPHLRGAACARVPSNDFLPGISPPAWGSRSARKGEMFYLRYIPTCVGQPIGKKG